jgi:ribosomal protein S18 acetylase RimI-like enzyme
MQTSTVVIRPLHKSEISQVARELPFDKKTPPGRHREYFAMQQTGEAVCLIAWLEGRPVGHVLMRWKGTWTEPMASQLQNCPHLSALVVDPEHRSRGIGTQLMEMAEDLARRRGYTQIGLSVSTDNDRARALYARRGYRDAGFGVCRKRRRYLDENRREQFYEEECVYLVKPILR